MAEARVIMMVGTGSHAGKSVLAAAVCRIFARRGLRVAPFKAQNMALNSYVTPDGGELGRAQAYQATAAGVEPHVDMNPVLLKPSSMTGSQVIVLGKPVGHMSVHEYHAYQPTVWPVVTAALARLRAVNDLVVIEGAGSPAEINLRERDIVNMKVALHAKAPTLLIGDIDRGGVFASLVGHWEIFTPEERELVRGYIINKFRGDASLLDSGLEYLKQRTGVPTIGVIPMLTDWRGDEEDSLGIDDRRRKRRPDAPIQIAVIRLPFISNFTDFDTLADEDDVSVRFVTSVAELGTPQVIVLPGTKSTIADLAWLRASGLAAAIGERVAAGTQLVGICGGYQMLGQRILDPGHVESAEDEVAGLGLLDTVTTFAGEKRTVRVQGELLGAEHGGSADFAAAAVSARGEGAHSGSPAAASALGVAGTALSGYEIHMGRTVVGQGSAPLLRLRAADPPTAAATATAPALSDSDAADSAVWHTDGAVSADGRICGSYVHGLFDHPQLRTAFLNGLRAAAGLPEREATLADPADDIDRLADHVAAHLDMALLEEIVGLSAASAPSAAPISPTSAAGAAGASEGSGS